MQQMVDGIEPMFTIPQIARVWRVSTDKARELFLGRAGVINVGTAQRKLWRVPMSVLLAVIEERGSTPEQAEKLAKALREQI